MQKIRANHAKIVKQKEQQAAQQTALEKELLKKKPETLLVDLIDQRIAKTSGASTMQARDDDGDARLSWSDGDEVPDPEDLDPAAVVQAIQGPAAAAPAAVGNHGGNGKPPRATGSPKSWQQNGQSSASSGPSWANNTGKGGGGWNPNQAFKSWKAAGAEVARHRGTAKKQTAPRSGGWQ